MDFIKKHYEKILLGVVLLGLAVAAALLPFKIASEKQDLEEIRNQILGVNVKPLPPVDLSRAQAAYQRLELPVVFDFSGAHNLFNPVLWQKSADGRMIKLQAGTEAGVKDLTVTKIIPLYLTIGYEGVGASDGTYLLGVEREAETNPSKRRKKSSYVSLNAKGEVYTLREVKGTPDKPELVIELSDTGERVSVTPEKPYRRVDGYAADFRYELGNKTWSNKRRDDTLSLAGDVFTIASINLIATGEYEVVLSAKSTGKKYVIKYNAAP